MALKNTKQTLRRYLTDHSESTFETPGEAIWLGRTLLTAIEQNDGYSVPWHGMISGYEVESTDLDSEIYTNLGGTKKYIMPEGNGPMVPLELQQLL